MILSHIVAAAANDVIGVDNGLPWNIPEDVKFFRDKTKGKAIIMGRKTFESMDKPLPHRLNIVITRRLDFRHPDPKVVVMSDLASAIEHAKHQTSIYGEEIFIIGGGEVYRESLPLVDVIYLTRIHQNYAGTVTYPRLPEDQFELIERRDRFEPVSFSFLTYTRRN